MFGSLSVCLFETGSCYVWPRLIFNSRCSHSWPLTHDPPGSTPEHKSTDMYNFDWLTFSKSYYIWKLQLYIFVIAVVTLMRSYLRFYKDMEKSIQFKTDHLWLDSLSASLTQLLHHCVYPCGSHWPHPSSVLSSSIFLLCLSTTLCICLHLCLPWHSVHSPAHLQAISPLLCKKWHSLHYQLTLGVKWLSPGQLAYLSGASDNVTNIYISWLFS